MTEHSERAWPRYGEGADDQRSRPSFGSSSGSLSETPTSAEQPGRDAGHEAAHEPRQAQGSPHASGVESNGVGSEIPNPASSVPVSQTRFDQPQAVEATEEAVAARAETSAIPTWAEQPAADAGRQSVRESRETQGSPDASGVDSSGVGDQMPNQASSLPVSEARSDQYPAAVTVTHVDWVPPRGHGQPGTDQRDSWRLVDDFRRGRRSRSHTVTFVCSSVMIGLVVVLKRRNRRC